MRCFLGLRTFLVLLALGASGSVSIAYSQEDRGYQSFRDRHHCEILQRLARLQVHKAKRNRFIIVGKTFVEDHFAQCLFESSGKRVLCEASSGFFIRRRLGGSGYRPSGATVAAIARLGFSTDDSEGNFQRVMDAETPTQLSAVADLLLATLYEAYGAREGTALTIKAPLAPLKRSERASCVPLS